MKREDEKREPANTITRELFIHDTEDVSNTERMLDIEETTTATDEEEEGKDA